MLEQSIKNESCSMRLSNKISVNKQSLGFTLIELLVSIMIIGVLSAIALPSYLNQTSKAKGTEAKANLGTINRAQQVYYLEKNVLANTLNILDAKISQRYYSYGIASASSTDVETTTTSQTPDLRVYSTRLEQSGSNFLQIICESQDIVANGSVATVPSSLASCPASYKPVN
jgi:type IV pilus assembly protein PilA